METLESFTDIVQIPVIRVNGKVLQPIADYSKLDYRGLYAVAQFHGGDIEYIKMRATIAAIDDADLCTKRDCFNPRKSCHHASVSN